MELHNNQSVYSLQRNRIYKRDWQKNESTFYINQNLVRTVNNTGLFDSVFYYDGLTLLGRKDAPYNLTYFYHPDQLGSTTLVTNASGAVTEFTNFKPYGEVLIGGLSRYEYTGKEKDLESGLEYYGARYYNPAIGRFVEADLNLSDKFNPQYLNRYVYVLNNPYKYIDLDGREAYWIGVGVSVGIGIPNPLWAYGMGPKSISFSKSISAGIVSAKSSSGNVELGLFGSIGTGGYVGLSAGVSGVFGTDYNAQMTKDLEGSEKVYSITYPGYGIALGSNVKGEQTSTTFDFGGRGQGYGVSDEIETTYTWAPISYNMVKIFGSPTRTYSSQPDLNNKDKGSQGTSKNPPQRSGNQGGMCSVFPMNYLNLFNVKK